VAVPGGTSVFSRLKKPAQRATWSRFKAQAEYLSQVDVLGDTGAWLEGIAPGKVADFAGEAAAQDIDTLSRYDPVKRLALVACLVHTARMRARDDLADPRLRARVTAATNNAESYHGFAQWLGFGNNGVLADNDPAEQEKLIKLNTLLANLVIFHNALDIIDVVRGLAAEGWTITAAELGALSPYLRGHISRFGTYATDELAHRPEVFNPVLKEVDFTTVRRHLNVSSDASWNCQCCRRRSGMRR
jgi:hypothetical protein